MTVISFILCFILNLIIAKRNEVNKVIPKIQWRNFCPPHGYNVLVLLGYCMNSVS